MITKRFVFVADTDNVFFSVPSTVFVGIFLSVHSNANVEGILNARNIFFLVNSLMIWLSTGKNIIFCGVLLIVWFTIQQFSFSLSFLIRSLWFCALIYFCRCTHSHSQKSLTHSYSWHEITQPNKNSTTKRTLIWLIPVLKMTKQTNYKIRSYFIWLVWRLVVMKNERKSLFSV